MWTRLLLIHVVTSPVAAIEQPLCQPPYLANMVYLPTPKGLLINMLVWSNSATTQKDLAFKVTMPIVLYFLLIQSQFLYKQVCIFNPNMLQKTFQKIQKQLQKIKKIFFAKLLYAQFRCTSISFTTPQRTIQQTIINISTKSMKINI